MMRWREAAMGLEGHFFKAIFFTSPGRAKMVAAVEKISQSAFFGPGRGRGTQVFAFGKFEDHGRIQRIGFGFEAFAFCKSAQEPGVDEGKRDFVLIEEIN
jgi:hypothetical protein